MSDAAKVLGNAQGRFKRAQAKGKQGAKDSARHKRTNARIARKVAKRQRTPKGYAEHPNYPWNKMHPESDMRLYICDSVKVKLRELDNADWERKHGK